MNKILELYWGKSVKENMKRGLKVDAMCKPTDENRIMLHGYVNQTFYECLL